MSKTRSMTDGRNPGSLRSRATIASLHEYFGYLQLEQQRTDWFTADREDVALTWEFGPTWPAIASRFASLSQKELARVLGCSEKTVKRHRERQLIRVYIGESWTGQRVWRYVGKEVWFAYWRQRDQLRELPPTIKQGIAAWNVWQAAMVRAEYYRDPIPAEAYATSMQHEFFVRWLWTERLGRESEGDGWTGTPFTLEF